MFAHRRSILATLACSLVGLLSACEGGGFGEWDVEANLETGEGTARGIFRYDLTELFGEPVGPPGSRSTRVRPRAAAGAGVRKHLPPADVAEADAPATL